MNFDWSHYLDLAQELYQQATTSPHEEADLRSSVSRAYYSAFHKARLIAQYKWSISIPQTADAHSIVRAEFSNRNYRKIVTNLGRMRFYRNKADYDDVVNDLANIAKENLKLSKQVIESLKTIM